MVMLVDFDDEVEVVEVVVLWLCCGMLMINWLCGMVVSKKV